MNAGYRIAAALHTAVSLTALAALTVITSAHVGSPDTWFEGQAGRYPVLVHVKSPGVIPGIAEVTVRVLAGAPSRVMAHVNRFDAANTPPPPDHATPLVGEPNAYGVSLWVMTGGSNSVTIRILGDRGEGSVVVPATIVAHRRLSLGGGLAWLLIGVGIFLFVGLVTIVGAAVRESVVEPGTEPDPVRVRRSRLAMGFGTAFVALLVFGGSKWWELEDRRYRASIFRPMAVSARLDSGATRLVLSIDDSSWRARAGLRPTGRFRTRYTPLVPDHGKLMHLFLIRDDLTAFAHLHPTTGDTVQFGSTVPALPAGRYRVLGDITHESGFAQTLSTQLDLPGSAGVQPASSDDSWFTGEVSSGTSGQLGDGARLEWDRGSRPIVAGRPAPLRFRVLERDGSPANVQAYMGMAAHAVVANRDGSVFIHLHPMGTVSAAAAMTFRLRTPADTAPGSLAPKVASEDAAMAARDATHTLPGEFSFPYAFPGAGRFRLWVQVKREGKVQTAAFDVEVE